MRASLSKAFALLAILGMVSVASAQTTLLNDTFGDNSRADGPGLLDTAWYTTLAAGTNLTASSGTMVFAGADVRAVGAFAGGASQTIATGWALDLTFNFTFAAAPTANGALVRFGLYNAMGTLATGDASTADDNDRGYWAYLNTTAGLTDFRKETNADTSVLGGADGVDLDAVGAGSAAPALGTSTHTAELILQRTGASSMLLKLLVDGTELYSITDTSATTDFLTFNEVGIGRASTAQTMSVDNIQVVYSQVPEPGALSLLALAGLGLLRRRRS